MCDLLFMYKYSWCNMAWLKNTDIYGIYGKGVEISPKENTITQKTVNAVLLLLLVFSLDLLMWDYLY